VFLLAALFLRPPRAHATCVGDFRPSARYVESDAGFRTNQLVVGSCLTYPVEKAAGHLMYARSYKPKQRRAQIHVHGPQSGLSVIPRRMN